MSEKARAVLRTINENKFLTNDLRRAIYDAAALLGYTRDEEKEIADEIINHLKDEGEC
jgi:hypothetical protein